MSSTHSNTFLPIVSESSLPEAQYFQSSKEMSSLSCNNWTRLNGDSMKILNRALGAGKGMLGIDAPRSQNGIKEPRNQGCKVAQWCRNG